jgi:hypothetical protein
LLFKAHFGHLCLDPTLPMVLPNPGGLVRSSFTSNSGSSSPNVCRDGAKFVTQ